MNAREELHHIQAAKRHRKAFAPLYDHYVGLVWNYALARLRDPDHAADATSQTFTKAIAALPTFEPQLRGNATTFRSWLMTIARNVVMDELRRKPSTPMSEQALMVASSESGPEDIAIALDRKRELLQAYAQLSDQQQDVVRLRQQGLTGEEIGAALGLSVGAVKSTHHRAIQRLRHLLHEGDES